MTTTHLDPGTRDEARDAGVQDPSDAVVRLEAVTACGPDVLPGGLPPGRPYVSEHAAVGTVTSVGAAVRGLAAGDRVVVSWCGTCPYCGDDRRSRYLVGEGWSWGHLVDGVRGELVRVPFADRSASMAGGDLPRPARTA